MELILHTIYTHMTIFTQSKHQPIVDHTNWYDFDWIYIMRRSVQNRRARVVHQIIVWMRCQWHARERNCMWESVGRRREPQPQWTNALHTHRHFRVCECACVLVRLQAFGHMHMHMQYTYLSSGRAGRFCSKCTNIALREHIASRKIHSHTNERCHWAYFWNFIHVDEKTYIDRYIVYTSFVFTTTAASHTSDEQIKWTTNKFILPIFQSEQQQIIFSYAVVGHCCSLLYACMHAIWYIRLDYTSSKVLCRKLRK